MFHPVGEKSRLVLASSSATIEAYEGAVRSSKTITSLVDWLRHVRRGPAGDLAMIGRTERTAARNLIGPLTEMLGPRRCSYNRGTGTLNLLGRTVFIVGANNEAATAKIQGMTLAGLYCDEVATQPESFFNMATTRLSVAGARAIVTCNPEGRSHWFKTKWLDKAVLWLDRDGKLHRGADSPLRLHRYTYTIDDNPYLAPEFVARLKASYSGVWYRRFILSEWTNAEGAIYDMWDPDLHVVDALPQGVTITARLVGVDYGTTNATHAVLLGLGSDHRMYVLDEWRHDSRAGESRWTDAQISAGLRAWLDTHPPVTWICVDPSAASFHAQLFADGLTNVAPADNAVVDGIRETASLLTLDRLQVLARCTALIGEMPQYAWDPKATEKGEDKPIKANDHGADALRYAVRMAVALWGLLQEGDRRAAA